MDVLPTSKDTIRVRVLNFSFFVANAFQGTFPMAAKTIVKGANAHPFYKWAAEARPKDLPRWNFHKYLIGRDGYIADVFPESVEPSDTRIRTAIGS